MAFQSKSRWLFQGKCSAHALSSGLAWILFICSLAYQGPLQASGQARHMFFFHNRFLEVHGLDDAHPEYGVAEYAQILQRFRDAGLIVHSEQRRSNVNARSYAEKIVAEIRDLMAQGVTASEITVVGTSKGGYIAQYVSTLLMQPEMNFVFIGSFREADLGEIPGIQFCGRILNIYERSDPLGNSARARADAAPCPMDEYRDLELNNGLRHGFLFRALDEWVQPTIDWAMRRDLDGGDQS